MTITWYPKADLLGHREPLRLVGVCYAGLTTGDYLGPVWGLPIGGVLYFNYFILLNILAEVHGNRTHPSPLDDTPDLKSGGPTSEPCTSVICESNILIITMPSPLASPFPAVFHPTFILRAVLPKYINTRSSIPHFTFHFPLCTFHFFCHLCLLFWPDCRFFSCVSQVLQIGFGIQVFSFFVPMN